MPRRSAVRQWAGGGPYSLGLHRRDDVNRAFGGGLPRGSLILLEGGYGSGKSVFSGRFAYGLCEESHAVTLLSTERPVQRFCSQMRALSYPVEEALGTRDLLYLYGDVAGLDREGEQAPELLPRLTGSTRMWEADVILLDSFGEVLRFDREFDRLTRENDRRRAARRVVAFLSSITANGRTVVLTVDPVGLPESVMEPFRMLSDGVLELSRTPGGSSARRSVEVRRFAGATGPVRDRIDFSVRPGAGIVIDNRTVVRR
jgi:flagellar protein FlaH